MSGKDLSRCKTQYSEEEKQQFFDEVSAGVVIRQRSDKYLEADFTFFCQQVDEETRANAYWIICKCTAVHLRTRYEEAIEYLKHKLDYYES